MVVPSIKQKIGLVLFGLCLSVALLETGLRIGGSVILHLQEQKNKISSEQKEAYRILCLGGSTTAEGGEQSYPRQLERILNQRSPGVKFKVINKGVCGINSAFILSSLRGNLDRYEPDMVITMMGANDGISTIAYQNTLTVNIKLFVKGLRVYKLVNLIHSAARGVNKKEGHEQGARKNQQTVDRNKNAKDESNIPAVSYLLYREKGQIKKAEEALKEGMKIDPGDLQLYADLGDEYILQGRHKEAEEVLKKVIEIAPEYSYAYAILGWCYTAENRFPEAEETFKKAIEINPMCKEAYTELANCYRAQGKTAEFQELINNIKALGLKNDYFQGFIATCYSQQGRHKEAERYYKKANEYRMRHYKDATRYNYQRLGDIVTEKGIRLVCVQYPVRSVGPLKKLFDSAEGIIFVDNEEIFRRAVKYGSYSDYFLDNFGGDFGHCTRKGNRLLAENIADVILKKCF